MVSTAGRSVGPIINQKSNGEPADSKKKVLQFIQQATLLTERGHEIEEVLEAGREGALLVLLEAEVQRRVDDQAQLRNHLQMKGREIHQMGAKTSKQGKLGRAERFLAI